MLRFADRLSREPKAATQQDIDVLRREGLSDHEILDLVQVVAFFNYVNRLTEGLGLEADD